MYAGVGTKDKPLQSNGREIVLNNSNTESGISDDETDGNHEKDMAAAASSEHLEGYFLYLHPPKVGFWGE
ncbi:hypothetical protein C0J52_27006 [Blattella germanica]|nr:hypothetical protein C0J52_27006 [Blattella germanica]